MRQRIRIARGTKTQLTNYSSTIEEGVPIYTTDEKMLYIGNKTTPTNAGGATKLITLDSDTHLPSDVKVGNEAYLDDNNNVVGATAVYFDQGVPQPVDGALKNDILGTAANSTKVQNVDFSASNISTFGNYVISKKETLWTGNEVLPVDRSYIDIEVPTAIEINLNDMIEIIYRPTFIGSGEDSKRCVKGIIWNNTCSIFDHIIYYTGNNVTPTLAICTIYFHIEPHVDNGVNYIRVSYSYRYTNVDSNGNLTLEAFTASYGVPHIEVISKILEYQRGY